MCPSRLSSAFCHSALCMLASRVSALDSQFPPLGPPPHNLLDIPYSSGIRESAIGSAAPSVHAPVSPRGGPIPSVLYMHPGWKRPISTFPGATPAPHLPHWTGRHASRRHRSIAPPRFAARHPAAAWPSIFSMALPPPLPAREIFDPQSGSIVSVTTDLELFGTPTPFHAQRTLDARFALPGLH
jgi:hypothetical protein